MAVPGHPQRRHRAQRGDRRGPPGGDPGGAPPPPLRHRGAARAGSLDAALDARADPPVPGVRAARRLRGRDAARPPRPDAAHRAAAPRAQEPVVDPGHPSPAPALGARGPGRHLRRDRGRRPPGPSPLRQLHHQRAALHRGGLGGPRGAGDQADPLPHLVRLAARQGADPRGRGGQAGGGGGRAQGALRRGQQHRVGRGARQSRRPRLLRPRRAQDPRQGGPGGAPRGGAAAFLRPHRHRQLQRRHRRPLHRPRPLHRRPGDRRRRGQALQPPDRLSSTGRGSTSSWSPRST